MSASQFDDFPVSPASPGRSLTLTRYRRVFPVISRVISAVIGGYALAALAVASISSLFVSNRAYGILTATLLSFAIYAVAILWCFACRDAWRAWGGLGVASCGLALLWLFGWSTAR